MKPTKLFSNRMFLAFLAIGLTAGLVSWDYQQTPGQFNQAMNDTTPHQKKYDLDKKVKSLDDVLDKLDNADMQLKMEKIKDKLDEAMKGIDEKKLQLEIDNALKQVDLEKIQKQVQESLDKVDFAKVKDEVAKALQELDLEKIKKQVQASLASVDWDEMRAKLDDVKNVQLPKVREQLKEIQPKLEKELKKAKLEMEKAKSSIREYKGFVDGLENDGLINKEAGYTLKHKSGKLFINGKKASKETYSKYKDFLESHKTFELKRDEDGFKMDMD